MRNHLIPLLALATATASPAAAQLGLPPIGQTVGDVLGRVDRTLDPLQRTVDGVTTGAVRLAQDRLDRLGSLLRRNRDTIERDAAGELARKGEVLLLEPSDAQLDAARNAGFALIERTRLDELGLTVARLRVPAGMSLAR